MVTRKHIVAAVAAVTLVAVGASRWQGSARLRAQIAGPVEEQIQPFERACIIGVSKDLCGGELSGGEWMETECVQPDGTPCRTLIGKKALLTLSVQSNQGQCEPGGKCDEAEELFGPLQARVDFRIRRDRPCQTRGCWDGRFELKHPEFNTVAARGNLRGTAGVGTHRAARCGAAGETCGEDCEMCYAASFYTASGLWRIHVEAAVQGIVLQGPHKGCRMCLTLQGDFIAPGDTAGPRPPVAGAAPWRFCGTMDGVLECKCPTSGGGGSSHVGLPHLDLDLDGDGDIDVNDFAGFQVCFNGPANDPACE